MTSFQHPVVPQKIFPELGFKPSFLQQQLRFLAQVLVDLEIKAAVFLQGGPS